MCPRNCWGHISVSGESWKALPGLKGPDSVQEFPGYAGLGLSNPGSACLRCWDTCGLPALCCHKTNKMSTSIKRHNLLQHFVLATLWHKKSYGHLFAAALCCNKHFYGSTKATKGNVYFLPNSEKAERKKSHLHLVLIVSGTQTAWNRIAFGYFRSEIHLCVHIPTKTSDF